MSTVNPLLLEYSWNGSAYTNTGTYGSGSANGQFDGLWGLAVDASGSIWEVDQDNNRV